MESCLTLRRAATVLLGLCAAAGAHAALIAADDFESYAAGVQFETSTTQLDGGTGFTAPYNANDSFRGHATVAASGLSYSAGAIDINGGNRALRLTGDAGVVDKVVARPFALQTGTVYFSFLYRTNNPADNEDFVQIGFSGAEDGEPKISVGSGGGASAPPFFIRIPNGTAGNASGATTMQPNTTYLMVGRVSKAVGSSNYDQLSLYLNPTTDTEPASALLSRTASSTIPNLTHFIVRTARFEAGDVYTIDQLRIGTTYADVVPEPGSLTLLATASGLLLSRRRRR